ncbi:MAG: YaaA family protein [Pseudomonadota bacterium]|nr:YaaA family protein [Pseudomonadota bacterium]MEC8461154.1 YaaA family protein [Pseudomonadota bacterium]
MEPKLLVTLSPAKKMHEPGLEVFNRQQLTQPAFAKESQELASLMQTLTLDGFMATMGVSQKIATMNMARYQNFGQQAPKHAAIELFAGDVYRSLSAGTLKHPSLNRLADQVFIISGLYGLLRTTDMIHPYRLEMGSKLKQHWSFDLYQFWSDRLTHYLNRQIEQHHFTEHINLASSEYAKAYKTDALSIPSINVDFKKPDSSGQFKTIGIVAKRARGDMARFIVEEAITNSNALKSYRGLGFSFNYNLSNKNLLVFTCP